MQDYAFLPTLNPQVRSLIYDLLDETSLQPCVQWRSKPLVSRCRIFYGILRSCYSDTDLKSSSEYFVAYVELFDYLLERTV